METALKLAEPERSPEREALADAIESRAVDVAAVEHIEAAIQLAREGIRNARTTVVEAEEALEAAKSERTQNLVSRAKGELKIATMPAREARAELESAQDELDACIEAEASLQQQLKQAQSNLSFSAPKVKRCAEAVIQADEFTYNFLRRFVAIEREYQTALAFLDYCPRLHPTDKHAIMGDRKFNVNEAIAPWRDWQARLATDPDAICHLPIEN